MMRRFFSIAALLVLPLAALLFAQWPLRELMQAGSRQANDLAQIIFALYVAVAVTAASETGMHLSAGLVHLERGRRRAWAGLVCMGPWALFLLWSAAPGVWQSLVSAERFPETMNPGFFIVKVALWLMAALVLADAARRAVGRCDKPHD